MTKAEATASLRAKAASQGDKPIQMKGRQLVELLDELAKAEAENAELEARINTPLTDDWFDGVRLEAAHQIERWSSEHDAGKSPLDWFWLIGYLAQKAAMAELAGNNFKAKHHTISTAAALLNWHRRMTGESESMRPGIATPEGEQ